MSPPLVSFLMPVAAPAPFLEETIGSLLAQTVDDWELVAVVDGPGDDVRRVLQDHLGPRRLRVVQLASRRGIGHALNHGLKECRGEFVARIDADDICLDSRLTTQLSAANRWPCAAVIGGNAALIDAHGNHLRDASIPVGPDVRYDLLKRNVVFHSAAFLRRELLAGAGGYNEVCHLREDYELWLRLGARYPIANCEEVVIKYRLSPNQASKGRLTREALVYVGASRIALGRALGASVVRTKVAQGVWNSAQNQYIQRARARLRALPGGDK